ncbi:alpha-galactosidase [Chryseolinea sp. Jin1]|uniref:Alpha-galactosidase n=2 Tax=Chryseolinea lacunae TaxID=2801331 RepID=A0ABS1KZ98_9BACT|nr:alpha-galactosidase [Chryseolinea lacunae]
MRTRSLLFVGALVLSMPTHAQLTGVKAELKNDTLTLENNRIKRQFRWNDGNLISTALINKVTGDRYVMNDQPDFAIATETAKAEGGSLQVNKVLNSVITENHIEAVVTTRLGSLEVKRVFRLYEDCAVIACDYYLKGSTAIKQSQAASGQDLKNIEGDAAAKEGESQAVRIEKINVPDNHWRATAVEFFDVTDRNNTLTQKQERLLYRQESSLRGNLLLMQSTTSAKSFFVLKEAPVSGSQLYYPGYDFTVKFGEVKVFGLGVGGQDLQASEWVRGYSYVTGFGDGPGEQGLLSGLRTYQQKARIQKPERDEMILVNTWGDRGQDTKVTEAFVLKEITTAAALGATHLQVDDGWQSGRSSNSAFAGGSLKNIWKVKDYWEPHPQKFPNGLAPVLKLAKEKNITLSLWFNPSTDSSFKHWENDADVLINQYKKYGITMWKIDGVQIPDKAADINFRKMLDKVMAATNNQAVFNLDVTAGRRFGYHYMYEYGNLFLENRYTDWGNYYPHFTLRNLWHLSHYIPAQRLQIEFLNKWRNANKYAPTDPLAPAKYSFDYLFAITLVAQPLGWFESQNLPLDSLRDFDLIKVYKKHWHALHAGKIFPLGDEPSGYSWTGFQSLAAKEGFIIVFREHNTQSTHVVNTLLPPGTTVRFTKIAGDGKDFTTKTGTSGEVKFTLSKPLSYVIYKYTIQ